MKAFLMAAMLAVTLAGCTGAPADDDFVVPDQDDQGRYIIKMTAANRFSPMNAQVPVNATVVWVLEGGVHNTKSDDGLWSSEVTADKGDHFEYRFEAAGDYGYHCVPHQSVGMEGTIRVA